MFHGTPQSDVNWTSVNLAMHRDDLFLGGPETPKGMQESSEKALRVMRSPRDGGHPVGGLH